MSAAPSLKYNPGLRGDQELFDRFSARQRDLSWILGRIAEATRFPEKPCQHMLTIGARGMGKTTLVRRVAAELRRDSAVWYPIVFPEESYLPSTAGEFWLECIFHLGEQLGDDNLRSTYADLRRERDESRLYERCLAVLLEHATRANKRFLLVVENLGMLLGEQIAETDAWRLRQALAHQPRILMLATATARFEQIDGIDHAWFELFSEHQLEPLSRDECTEVWTAVNGAPPEGDSIRAVQILTGGNLRLLTIMAEFSIKRSFQELMDRLVELVDSHTEYFKSHLDALPAQERKVFAVLLDLWHPATAAEVAEHGRLSTNVCSSLLKRLTGRGAVTITGERKRDRRYQVTERLFNIYYLMRRRGEKAEQVRMLVSIAKAVYSSRDLNELVRNMAKEVWVSPEERRRLCLAVVAKLAEEVDPRLLRALTPHQILELGGDDTLVAQRRALLEPEFVGFRADWRVHLLELLESPKRHAEVGHEVEAWFEAMSSAPMPERRTLSSLCLLLHFKVWAGHHRWLNQALKLDPGNNLALLCAGVEAMKSNQYAEASEILARCVEIEPADERAWVCLAIATQESTGGLGEVLIRMTNALPASPMVWSHMLGLLEPETRQDTLPTGALAQVLESIEGNPFEPALLVHLVKSAYQQGTHEALLTVMSNRVVPARWLAIRTALTILCGRQPTGAPEFIEVARDLAAKIRTANEAPAKLI